MIIDQLIILSNGNPMVYDVLEIMKTLPSKEEMK
jgi:hypothetical protein